ncbi:hypothetical protein ACZ90_08295 [Streptomyces albus subsp. albus]|nr:hypothetical protein ACZ90_08295 [Streptomyces albus subsp. albus]
MNRLVRALGVLAASAGLAAFSAAQANAAGDVYQGTGWKILTNQGIQSLSPDPYVIQLVKPTPDDKLTPAQNKAAEKQLRAYLAKSAAQLTKITGTRFTVSGTYHKPVSECSAVERHTIVVGVGYRPSPQHTPGRSQTWPCYAKANHSAWGGWIWMDSEYWNPAVWKIEPWRLANLVSHEMGHSIGLDHPNVDGKDANKTADPYECVTNRSKDLPVLCSPNGGYAMGKGGSVDRTKQHAGEYTAWDIAGLKALKKNFG